jgi:glutathione peroxidase-family protein
MEDIMTLKSIYDIELNSADGEPKFLDQFKGKVTLVVNTTVGCGNANQMEVMQWLQEKYGGEHFQIVAIPTNDYCGPGVTYGKWSQGITCGLDSANYGKDVYGTTFQFSEMVSSNPNDGVSVQLNVEPGHNGLNQPNGTPHELYQTIAKHQVAAIDKLKGKGLDPLNMFKDRYFSFWLNLGFYNGERQGGNFEKYLVDADGYVHKHFQCTTLNVDVEKTIKDEAATSGEEEIGVGPGRSKKIFEEEWAVICQEIEELIAGKKSIINPSVA